MQTITLTNGAKIVDVQLIDKIKDNGEQYTIAVKGKRVFKIADRYAEIIRWRELK